MKSHQVSYKLLTACFKFLPTTWSTQCEEHLSTTFEDGIFHLSSNKNILATAENIETFSFYIPAHRTVNNMAYQSPVLSS